MFCAKSVRGRNIYKTKLKQTSLRKDNNLSLIFFFRERYFFVMSHTIFQSEPIFLIRIHHLAAIESNVLFRNFRMSEIFLHQLKCFFLLVLNLPRSPSILHFVPILLLLFAFLLVICRFALGCTSGEREVLRCAWIAVAIIIKVFCGDILKELMKALHITNDPFCLSNNK